MTKAELDAEYEEKLWELQRNCDHVCDVVMPGRYGSDAYTTCPNCESAIRFHRGLNRLEKIVQWNDTKVVIAAFEPPHSDVQTELLYKEFSTFDSRYKFANWLQENLKGQPMSKWKELLQ